VPKLWADTIETHRREVRDAILDKTLELVAQRGLLEVTMSEIAEETGIGRATLYKYFPDVETILRAWHERQIAAHMEHLASLRDRAAKPYAKLQAVLEGYALLLRESQDHHDSELAAFLHQDEHVASARKRLIDMVKGLIADAARAGDVRGDVPPEELAHYSLGALGTARTLSSRPAVQRLVAVTLAGLRSK
jgi:AcrR family transcriptional regulator